MGEHRALRSFGGRLLLRRAVLLELGVVLLELGVVLQELGDRLLLRRAVLLELGVGLPELLEKKVGQQWNSVSHTAQM